MSIVYIDLVTPARDVGNGGKKTGFTAGEGYLIERVEDGAAFRISHPEKNGAPRRIPITNVASWGDDADVPKKAKRVADEGAELDEDDGTLQVRREGGTVHIGRAPEPAPAPKKGKRG